MRKSPKKYTEEDFNKVKKLMAEGYTMHWAAKLTGMRWTVAAYHLRPGYRDKQRKAAKKWVKNNLERKRIQSREHAKRYRKIHAERVRKNNRAYYYRNLEKMRSISRRYKKLHPKKIRGYQIKKRDERRARRLRINALAEHFKTIIKAKKGG